MDREGRYQLPQSFKDWKALPWGERVLTLRQALGEGDRRLTLNKLAERLSKGRKRPVSHITICRWCSGQHKPQGESQKALTRLARQAFRNL